MKNGQDLLSIAVVLLFVGAGLGLGCATPSAEEKPGKVQHLEATTRDFHTNLRWARYEHASNAVHEAYKQSFMGRYEELGEDFRVVDLTMKSAEIVEDGFEAIVEVDQEWYQLPDTTVQSARFVERWVSVEGVWKLRERMEREEYRDLGRVFPSAESDKAAAEAAEAEAAVQLEDQTDR